jgi:hypothetical protein
MLTLSIIKPVYYLVEPMVGLDTELLNQLEFSRRAESYPRQNLTKFEPNLNQCNKHKKISEQVAS